MRIDDQLDCFRRNLIRLRLERGLSQESLAALSGLDRTYVSMIERGKRTPTIKTILKIANAMQLDPAFLFEGVQHDEEQS